MSRFGKVFILVICILFIVSFKIAPAGHCVDVTGSFGGEVRYGDYLPEASETQTVLSASQNYPITVQYTFKAVMPPNTGGDYFGVPLSPRFNVYDSNNNLIGGDSIPDTNLYWHYNREGTRTGTITIPAGTTATITAYSGMGSWRPYSAAYFQFQVSYTLTYNFDTTAPPIPTGISVSGVTQINGYNYTRTFPVHLSWNTVIDGGSPASGIDYYTINSSNGGSRNSANNSRTDQTPYLFPSDNQYSVTVSAMDWAGNTSNLSSIYTFTLDTSPPGGTMVINNNNQYTNSTAVNLSLSNVSDGANGSGVSQMCFSNDGITYTNWESYNGNKSWPLTPGDATKTVYVKLKDQVGNETPNSSPIKDTIILDTTPPTGSVTINNGANSTDNPQVTLTLSAGDAASGVAGMRFSNDGTNYSSAEPYNITRTWILSDGDGPKTVYVKYTDQAGNTTTQPITANIYYDKNAPTGSIAINNGANYTNTTAVNLSLSATDNSGVTGMRFSNNGTGFSAWETYNTGKSWSLSNGDGLKTVTVQYKDQYNHISTYTDSITLDTTPPDTPILTVSPAGRTNNPQPVLTFTSNDTGSGLNHFELSIDNAEYYTVASPYVLSPQTEGQHSINIKAFDNAGNPSGTATATVTIDLTPPGVPTGFTHSFSDDYLTVNWQTSSPNNDLAEFDGDYTSPTGQQIDFSVYSTVTKAGKYDILLNGYGFNQPIIITVHSIDQTGNRSDNAGYTAYTKASLGTVTFLGTTYNSTTERPQFNWQVNSVPGTSCQQTIELGTIAADGGFIKMGSANADSAGLVVLETLDNHQSIQVHGAYVYRLVAYNNSGDATVGAVQPPITENIAPTKPVPVFPTTFGSSNAIFNYEPAIDHDGDDNNQLNYTVFAGAGTEPTSFTDLNLWDRSNFVQGQIYTWYVQADDGHGGVNQSDHAQFTVDNNKPELSVGRLGQPWTNQSELTVTANDSLCGIKSVTYQKIYSDHQADPVTLTPGSGGGPRTWNIPLEQGTYVILITAFNNAEVSEQINVSIQVDRTKPGIHSLNVNLTQFNGWYISGSSKVPVTFNTTDDSSGVNAIYYGLVSGQNQPLANGTLIPLRPQISNYSIPLNITAQPGQEYYLAVAVIDQAGNQSDLQYYGPIRFDFTPPLVNLNLTGPVTYGSGTYLADIDNLNITIDSSDPESGITGAGTQPAILDAGGNPVSGWGDWNTIKTALTPGAQYQIAARATNCAGLVTQKTSVKFIYDNTPPQVTSVNGPNSAVSAGEPVSFTINATEPESVIKQYRLAIVAGGMVDYKLSSLIPGNQDGWLILNSNSNSATFRLDIPAETNGSYYPLVEVTNAAGLTATQPGNSFTIDNNQEKVCAGDQGPYSMFSDHLTGSWKYLGHQQVTGYRYRIVGPNQQPLTDWQTTTATETTVTGLSLSSGQQYRYEVQAQYSDGSYSNSGYSSGVTIDTTTPELTSFITPECCTSYNLGFTWQGNDAESGITLVQAALGSDYNQMDVSGGWVTITGNHVLLTCDSQGNPLPLENGKRYYLTLRVTNGAGLSITTTNCGIVVDDTPPPAPLVLDQGAYINPSQSLKANWFWSSEDPKTGPNTYQWTLIKDGQDLSAAVWQNGNDSKWIEITVDQIKGLFPYLNTGLTPDGSTFYFAVRATNQAGLSSTGMSDGIIADSTAPYIPDVKVLNTINLDPNNPGATPEVNYITNNQNLNLWIKSYDPDTPIDQYYYAWGLPNQVDGFLGEESSQSGQYNETNQPGGVLIQLPDPSLDQGILNIFAGECGNKAQLVSATGYSGGVVLDTSAPKVTSVHGCVSGNRLFFDWEVTNSTSPIAYYKVILVRAEDAGTIPDDRLWTNIGLNRSYTVNGRNLADGKYCLLIKATNLAGNTSRRDQGEWGISPMVMLDSTPPIISYFSYDQYAANQLTVNINATDNLSGINGYQYALGSLSDPFKYSGGWVDFQADKHPVDTTNITHNSAVYLMVRAIDKVGLCSTPVTSGKIIIDHTKPVTPMVTCSQYTTSKTEIDGIKFASQDPESGVTNYRIGMVTEPGGDWLVTQTQPISQFNGRFTGLSLTEAGAYYIALQTQNGAGVWSDTGYSSPIIVDCTPPALNFAQAENTIVINHPPLGVQFTLTETAQVQFSLTASNGSIAQYTMNGQAGVNRFTFAESTANTYSLTAVAIDPAGNVGTTQTQPIRVNAPPQVKLPDSISATPGQRLNLSAIVVDPDGAPGDVFTYQWDPGDGGQKLTGSNPQYQYTKVGQFTLTVTVTDKDGGVTTTSTTVNVGNTTQGTLYGDEVWSGVHRIDGDVIVPAGITLTIAPGTQVIIAGIPGQIGSNNSLIIQGNLIVQNGAGFDSANDSAASGWKGIYVEGTATLDGTTISHAERGVVVINTAKVTITNSIFRNNRAGIHVYSSRPVIANCVFDSNLWYGVKEDEGGSPIVTGCTFTNNGIDYYHDTLTVITMDQLNQISGNNGNHHQD